MKSEREILDEVLSGSLLPEDRQRLWSSASNILKHGSESNEATGLALGYVQSGKTTQMIALTAAAYDAGYRVIIALLGTTNILLDQNSKRFAEKLQIDTRNDFRWVEIKNPSGSQAATKISENLLKGRAVLIPLLKHKGRIEHLTEVLRKCQLTSEQVLILDDEADQASLNSKVNDESESKVYESLSILRSTLNKHLYIQFTATPYAQLLLEQDDHLAPDFVEFLHPGKGYVGGREFFIDNASKVVRAIPLSDEQNSNGKLLEVPNSLKMATANFIAGAALLLVNDSSAKTISMLVHSTHKNKIQEVYHFLLKLLVKNWRENSGLTLESLPSEILQERRRLVENGALDISDADFIEKVNYVLREVIFWLVNSASDVKKVNWFEGPIHILVGGNKLDRGFTVEGLTVTYMNRPTSDQIDTLEQRARAFGYRGDLLPYCQFFATLGTVRMLRGIVHTEFDLRARLDDWITQGHSPKEWSREIGMLLPIGSKPTRSTVFKAITSFNERGGWHQLRMPSLKVEDMSFNSSLVRELGLLDADRTNYGRIEHRTVEVDSELLLQKFLQKWKWDGFSPGWEHDYILQLFESLGPKNSSGKNGTVRVLLMQLENEDLPRQREWRNDTGFVNLFQGKDASYSPDVQSDLYPGDRSVPIIYDGKDCLALQIHRIRPKGLEIDELFTLAVYLGDSKIVRGGSK